MRTRNLFLILVAGVAATGGVHVLSGQAADAAAAQPRKLKCECVLASSGLCGHVIGNLGGPSIVEWRQDFYVPPTGMPDQFALNQACYRKRNADGLGNGLCCDQAIGADEKKIIERLFRGTLE